MRVWCLKLLLCQAGSRDSWINSSETRRGHGCWFYLNGSHPRRGGVCVIADSHRPGWTGPEGFEFTSQELKKGIGGRSFRRPGAADQIYNSFDVPGCVPIVAGPGDMIVWVPRTYHAAFPLLDSWDDTRDSSLRQLWIARTARRERCGARGSGALSLAAQSRSTRAGGIHRARIAALFFRIPRLSRTRRIARDAVLPRL
jgi:hypothetical protein